MTLADILQKRLDNPTLSFDERARARCLAARELEQNGHYEAAKDALGDLWRGIGERPTMSELSDLTAADVLLRAGTITGWLGSLQHLEAAQEAAKDLISESITRFQSLGETIKAADAQSELGFCYRRTGALDEARVVYREAARKVPDTELELKARLLLRLSGVESLSGRLNDALRILNQATPFFEAIANDSLKGKFHNEFARTLRDLGTNERRQDYIDQSIIEFTAACFHFEQARHITYLARTKNNLGILFHKQGRYEEAHEYLNTARNLFVSLNQEGNVAQVDESRARVFLAQHRLKEAASIISGAVRTLEAGGEQGVLAEALMTEGIIKARLGEYYQSQTILRRAIDVAEQAGSLENAGLAALALLEEHSKRLTESEHFEIYIRCDELLAHTQDADRIARLRLQARQIAATHSPRAKTDQVAPVFVYRDEATAALLRQAQKFSSTSLPILITGETGVGKNLLARLIHHWSGRGGKFVSVNCAALNKERADSILFGHIKGSTSVAQTDQAGMIREAEGGTLFLDDIAALDATIQVKILRLIEHDEMQPCGATATEKLNVRLLASTSSDLAALSRKGEFRLDLFYRLDAFEIELSPLRYRRQDIIALSQHFITQSLASHNKRVRFTGESLKCLSELPLRGNARELRNLIDRAVVTAVDGTVITAKMLEQFAHRQSDMRSILNPWEGFSLPEEVNTFEAHFINRALEDSDGSVSRAARLLGLKHQSLSHMLSARHQNLQHARTPVVKRKSSIIKK